MSVGVSSNHKVRLFAKQPGEYSSGPFQVLKGGVIFPYTPTINFNHSANYGSYETTHSVFQPQYYINTPNPTISVTATFTAQSEEEALYSAAAIHFFQSVTKSSFGESANPGKPPSVLLFSGFGALHAERVPVVLRNFTYTLIEDTDYVTVDVAGLGETSIPTQFIVGLELAVQIMPSKASRFNLQNYQNGMLLRGGGYI